MKEDNTLFYHLPEEDKKVVFEQIASNTGITPYAVEKNGGAFRH